jgi:hypothetical protein
MSETGSPRALPLAAAALRLRKPPGRPRKNPTVLTSPATTATSASRGARSGRVGGVSSDNPRAYEAPAAPVGPSAVGVAPRLLGCRDAAVYLGISEASVREWLAVGVVPRVVIPLPDTAKRRGGQCRRVLVDVRDLDALIARSKAP